MKPTNKKQGHGKDFAPGRTPQGPALFHEHLQFLHAAKLLSKKDVAIHSCRQRVNACLSTFQPMANTGWYQSYIVASLGVLGVVEGIAVVVSTSVILIFSVFVCFVGWLFKVSHGLIVSISSRLCRVSLRCLWGRGGEVNLPPAERAQI